MLTEHLLGQCQMYIPITLGAVPDAVMVCGGQSLPRLWTLEREVTGNPRLLVPRTRLAVVIRHGEVTVTPILMPASFGLSRGRAAEARPQSVAKRNAAFNCPLDAFVSGIFATQDIFPIRSAMYRFKKHPS